MVFETYINGLLEKYTELDIRLFVREQDFAVVEIDMSSLLRRFENPVRFLVATNTLIEESLRSDFQWLDDRFIEFAANSELFPIIVTPPGLKARSKRLIRKSVFGREQPVISIDKLLKKGEGRELLSKELLEDVGYDLVSPYRVDTTTPGSMFFGRGKPLNRLRHLRGNLVVYGPRRIGKSSLVLQLQKELAFVPRSGASKKPSPLLRKCAYVDVSALGETASTEIWAQIIKSFGLDAHGLYKYYGRKVRLTGSKTDEKDAFLDEVKSLDIFISSFSGQLTIILDEVDGWIEREALSGWTAIDRLRALTDRGKANVILVGYESLQAAAENHRFPLFNRGDHLPLGPLNRDAVKEIILAPLAELRIRLSPENEIIERVWQASSGFPHLVQDICKHMVEKCLGSNDKKHVVDNNITKAAIDDSEAVAIYRRGVINSDFPLAEAIAGLTCMSSTASQNARNVRDTFSNDEIAGLLEQCGYEFDGREYDLALSYLSLRAILRPIDSKRSDWAWVNSFARQDMEKRIAKLGFNRWRDSVMRQHAEGSWKERYRVLGRLE